MFSNTYVSYRLLEMSGFWANLYISVHMFNILHDTRQIRVVNPIHLQPLRHTDKHANIRNLTKNAATIGHK